MSDKPRHINGIAKFHPPNGITEKSNPFKIKGVYHKLHRKDGEEFEIKPQKDESSQTGADVEDRDTL